MKAIQITHYGDNRMVKMNINALNPVPSDEQVLIRMHAAGLNPIDWKIREGYLQSKYPLAFPLTLGMDFSGTIVEIGKNVKNFQIGDEVYGMSNIFNGGTGTFADFFSVDASFCAHKPSKLTHTEAAVYPMAGISALQALTLHINQHEGGKILIHGGAGGIGSFAIQIAKYFGLYVATTVSEKNRQFVEDLGADEMINYKVQKFEHLLHGYDYVLDTVGGLTYKKSFQVLKKGGIIVSFREEADIELMKLHQVNAFIEFTDVNSTSLAKLSEFINKNIIHAHIDTIFAFEQTPQAIQHLESGHPQGKVVIEN
ncbi:MAG: NADP-dependent oxidoreductase [Legionellales bacterium]|nr:NADP-dependent oxidoreductase [Legionellales bacterium]